MTNRDVYDWDDVDEERVNPNHFDIRENFILAVKGQRREISEPPKTGAMVRLTGLDEQFLNGLNIRWK